MKIIKTVQIKVPFDVHLPRLQDCREQKSSEILALKARMLMLSAFQRFIQNAPIKQILPGDLYLLIKFDQMIIFDSRLWP
jgi:hypothetical protein